MKNAFKLLKLATEMFGPESLLLHWPVVLVFLISTGLTCALLGNLSGASGRIKLLLAIIAGAFVMLATSYTFSKHCSFNEPLQKRISSSDVGIFNTAATASQSAAEPKSLSIKRPIEPQDFWKTACTIEGVSLGHQFADVRSRFPYLHLNSKETRVKFRSATWETKVGLRSHNFARFRFLEGTLYSMLFITSSDGGITLLDCDIYKRMESLLGPADAFDESQCTWLSSSQDLRLKLEYVVTSKSRLMRLVVDKPSAVLLSGGASD